MIERRRLGKTGMEASVLGFGGSEIGYQRASLKSVERLLGGALDAGLNVIDTAECYEDSEELIGRAVGGAAATTTSSPSAGTPAASGARTGARRHCCGASSGASSGCGRIGWIWCSCTPAPWTC